jgi:hypothetical protein
MTIARMSATTVKIVGDVPNRCSDMYIFDIGDTLAYIYTLIVMIDAYELNLFDKT